MENDAAKEAACYCIAELCSKLDRQFLDKYAQELLNSLRISSKDNSWSVKDSAFYAST